MTEYPPYAFTGYGIVLPWGSIVRSTAQSTISVGDFNFQVIAKSEGYKIELRFTAPIMIEAPDWSRRLRILRKQGEWPQAYNDPAAHISVDAVFSTPGNYIHIEDNLVSGQIYYYALYAMHNNGSWVHDRFVDRGSAYPYDRWGHCEYLFDSLPRGWRSVDIEQGNDLKNFTCIFGALLDDIKTDAEHLLTLFEIDSIHDDLIYLLDSKIGWPTWHEASGLQRRKETAEAMGLYTEVGIGRSAAYEQILEEISDWEADIVEGWRYVFFTNYKYNSVTPDLSTTAKQNEIKRLMGRREDTLKYINDGNGWHSVAGLAFFLSEILGISKGLTAEMIIRYHQMIEWAKASYVLTHLVLIPSIGEIVGLPADEFEDVLWAYIDELGLSIDENISYWTTDLSLFVTNSLTSTVNTIDDRLFHSALDYV